MKLYSKQTTVCIENTINKKLSTSTSISLDNDFNQLKNNIRAYRSLAIVNETIALENYSIIDKHNYVIYNEYIKAITSNLDVEYIPVIAQETVELLPTTALNHNIALEGFLSDIWKKIKEIFNSIYNKIKELFVLYFTRLGRLERKLNNIKEVLEEMSDKDINLKESNIEKVPSSLANKYPLADTIGLTEVEKIFSNSKLLYTSVKSTLEISKEFANKDILSKDFIENMNKLKERSKELQTDKEKAKSEKNNTSPFTQARKDAKEKIKSIKDELENVNKELTDKETELNDLVKNNSDLPDLSSDDKKFEIVKKEFDDYIKNISTILEKVKNKELTSGKVIKDIKLSKEDIDVDIDTNKEKVTMVVLADRGNLLSLINDSLKILPDFKKTIEAFAEVNDTIFKQTEAVNKLIYDLDKNTDHVSGKYKTILQNKVKERLLLLKEFFSLYNKVNKLTNDTMTESLEGNVDYTALCLKYYG